MDEQPATKPTPKPEGMPLGRALAYMGGIAFLFLVLLVTVIWLNYNSNARVEKQFKQAEALRQQAILEQKEADQKAQLALARNRQEEVLVQARNATNVLGGLLSSASQLIADALALRTNDAGRRVGLHPDLVAQARRFYENDLTGIAATNDIVTKLESARRVEQQIVDNLGKAYQPESALMLTVQAGQIWGEQEQRKVAQLQTMLSSLVSESKVKVTSAALTPASPTLEDAIHRFTEAEAAFRQQVFATNNVAAKQQAAITEAEAEKQRILTDARILASNIVAEANEKLLAQQRDDALHRATNQVEDAKAQDKVRDVALLKKAAEPEVKTKLAPFITPGYWTPKGFSPEKKPLSYTMLLGEGALDPSPPGLGKLARIAMAVDDTVRPRWNLAGGRLGWFKVPASLEKVKEAQKSADRAGTGARRDKSVGTLNGGGPDSRITWNARCRGVRAFALQASSK